MGISITGGVDIGGRHVGGPPTAPGQELPGQYTAGFTNNDFDRDVFTAALQDKGYSVLWEQAAFCPNRGRAGLGNRDHPIACPICDGSGWIFYRPTPTQMLITSVTMQQNYYAQGGWSSGRVMVTALPEYRFHVWDRISIMDGVARFQEIVRRQPGTNSDRTKYIPLCVIHLSWVGRDGSLQIFTQDNDFFVTSDGLIVWPDSTRRPDDNTFYSASYEYHPRYVVQELTHQHRVSTVQHRPTNFPVAGVARLDFLLRDESKDDVQTDFEDPFKPR